MRPLTRLNVIQKGCLRFKKCFHISLQMNLTTINGCVTLTIFRRPEYYRELVEDFFHDCGSNERLTGQMLLKDLLYRFGVEGKSSLKYGDS